MSAFYFYKMFHLPRHCIGKLFHVEQFGIFWLKIDIILKKEMLDYISTNPPKADCFSYEYFLDIILNCYLMSVF